MSASPKKYAQSLEIGHPACRDACQRLTSLFYNSGGDRLTLVMSGDALDLLVGLAPHEAAARHALAAAASASWRAQAYPEARACIDALLPFEAEAPWAQTQFRIPWADQRPSSLTGARQLALLRLYRAECLLVLDEPPAGESAFTDALERANEAAVPDHLQVSAASIYLGTRADCRTFALVRAARALRLKFLGKDACLHRKIPKKRRGAPGDPAWLVTAGRYADDALATVSARAPEQYAGLRPQALYGHDLTPLQSNYFWQWEAYLEAALLDEMRGNIDRARHRIGQAKFYAALQDPTHTRDFTFSGLVECVARLGAVNTPLDEGGVPVL